MIFFLALIPATALVVGGYFVLFLSHRSEGSLQAFGKYLGFWAFSLAGLVILGAIFAAAHGRHHGEGETMRERWEGGGMMYHHPWPGGPQFFGPRDGERRNGSQPGEAGAAPPGPAAGAQPASPPSPAPAPAR